MDSQNCVYAAFQSEIDDYQLTPIEIPDHMNDVLLIISRVELEVRDRKLLNCPLATQCLL